MVTPESWARDRVAYNGIYQLHNRVFNMTSKMGWQGRVSGSQGWQGRVSGSQLRL